MKTSKTKTLFKFLLILFIPVVGLKIFADLGNCIPSFYQAFADVPSDLRCGTSNPNIVSIGNIVTNRISYQPSATSFDDIHNQVSVKYQSIADVTMDNNNNNGNLVLDSKLTVQGRYYSQEHYNSFGDLIRSETKFVPFNGGPNDGSNGYGPGEGNQSSGMDNGQGSGLSGGGFGNQAIRPNKISTEQFYLNTTAGSGASDSCLSNYSDTCLDHTYAERAEFNPDLKTISVAQDHVDYSQSDYTPPEPAHKAKPKKQEQDNSTPENTAKSPSTGSSKPAGQLTYDHPQKLPPELAQWKLEKIIQSYQKFEAESNYAQSKNQQFVQERQRQFENYQRHIEALANYNKNLQAQSQASLDSLSQHLKNYSPEPLKSQAEPNPYQAPTQFEYHQLEGQAREIIESKLSDALKNYDAYEYIKQAEILMNSNDFDRSKDKIMMNKSGIISSNLFDKSMGENYFDKVDLSNITSAHNREILRNTANKFQAAWIESSGLKYDDLKKQELFLAGVALYEKAKIFAENNGLGGLVKYTDASLSYLKAFHDFNMGTGSGAVKFVADAIMSIPELYTLVVENYHKIPTTMAEVEEVAGLIYRSYDPVKKALVDTAFKYRDDFIYGDAHRKGEIIGYALGEVASMLIPASKIASAGKILTKIDDVVLVEKIAKLGSTTLKTTVEVSSGIRRTHADDLLISLGKTENKFLKNNAEHLTSKLLKETDDDVLFAYKKIISVESKYDSPNSFNVKNTLVDQASFDETLKDLKHLSKSFDQLEPTTVKGIGSRYTSKADKIKYGTEPLDAHKGNVIAHGRYGLGTSDGLDVMSFGFADNLPDSKIISNLEYRNMPTKNPNDFLFGTKQIDMDGVLDLTNKKNLEILNISEKEILLLREANGLNAYTKTQNIGLMAYKKGYKAILAPSAQNNGVFKHKGNVLHVFGDQSL